MPIVHIHMLEGADIEKKRLLVKRITEVVCETLNRTPDRVRIILDEMPHDRYSIAGILHCDTEKP